MLCAAVILVSSVASLAASDENSRVRSVVCLLIGAAAAGYIENLCLSSMTLVWEPEDIGLVAGVLKTICIAASCIAISLYSSLLTNGLTQYLPEYVVPAATDAGLPASSLTALFAGITSGSFDDVPGISATITDAVGHAVKRAYSMSFRTVFLCTLPFGVILLVSAYLSPNIEEYLTGNVARKLQGKYVPRGTHGNEKTTV
jgi:hypothetical protein